MNADRAGAKPKKSTTDDTDFHRLVLEPCRGIKLIQMHENPFRSRSRNDARSLKALWRRLRNLFRRGFLERAFGAAVFIAADIAGSRVAAAEQVPHRSPAFAGSGSGWCVVEWRYVNP